MIDIIVGAPWRNPPFTWYAKNGVQHYNSNKIIPAMRGGSEKEPHQGGRHPFNILTEEIYNDWVISP